ncbi:MAG: helix-turn-helix transcriptional regulator [Desulfobacteraceae bacterium]|jgi:transcriptional regulator with XRE-family HTH domain
MKRYSEPEIKKMKDELYSDLAIGDIDIREATRRMRKIIGLTQADYAKKVAGISPRILSEFERGTGNPTIDTLERIGKPFGLKVSFLPPQAWRIKNESR